MMSIYGATENLQTIHVCGSDAGDWGGGRIRKLLFCTIVMEEARSSETLLTFQ